jgi:hypothetical protein
MAGSSRARKARKRHEYPDEFHCTARDLSDNSGLLRLSFQPLETAI